MTKTAEVWGRGNAFHDEKLLVAEGMKGHGGSFMQALGAAIERADATNTSKIMLTWPDEWDYYLHIGKGMQRARNR